MGRCQGPEPNQRLASWILHRPLAAAGFCALHVATGPRERRDHEREHRPVKDLPLRTSNDTCKVEMRIRIDIDGTVITATLEDSATARDFASLFPLTLTLRDYTATEKISDLPRRLSTQGAPLGFDPSIGDIAYYAPWGNLAIFCRDFGYSNGLIKLGAIESGGGVGAQAAHLQGGGRRPVAGCDGGVRSAARQGLLRVGP